MTTRNAGIRALAAAAAPGSGVADGVRSLARDGWLGIGALAVLGAFVWAIALTQVPYREVTDIGLVSVLPAWGYVSFAMLAWAFASMLIRPAFPGWLAVLLTLILIGLLYGTSPYLSGEPRLAVSWRHLGVIEYVVRRGGVDPSLDIYHNWPGFFVLVATLVDGLGLSDLRAPATWAPVWWSLACLPALHLLFSTLTDDRRVVWLAVWLFFLTNWIAQDYFAPQALGFFVFLVLTTLMVRWLARRDRSSLPAVPEGAEPADGRIALARRWSTILLEVLVGRESRAAALGTGRRAGLVAVMVLSYAFIVTGHQLTPFFILGTTATLMVLWRVRWLTLPVVMVVMIGAWVVFFAVPYLAGHLQTVVSAVGAVGEGVTANIIGRLEGSDGHRIVVRARVLFTLAVWLLAALGGLRRLRAGRWDVTAIALAIAPFPVFVLQTYGGEMLLRVTLFSLPFMALFVAFLVLPHAARAGRMSQLTIAGLVFVLATSLMLVRYGNERIETFSSLEVAAVDELYRTAPPGSQLMAISGNVPWKTTGYELYRLRPTNEDFFFGDNDTLIEVAQAYPGPVYLIITRSQRAYVELILGVEPGVYDDFATYLLESGWFEPVFRNEDAVIARFLPAPAP
jgi:hypothetical protein